jgi:fluoride exporter
MRILIQSLAIGAGGFVGALARWAVVLLFGSRFNFPIATFVINITGSFFLGWFMTFMNRRYAGHVTLRLAIATGFVGAYTTFSTFMFESMGLLQKGAELMAIINLMGSVLVGLLGVWLGMAWAGH